MLTVVVVNFASALLLTEEQLHFPSEQHSVFCPRSFSLGCRSVMGMYLPLLKTQDKTQEKEMWENNKILNKLIYIILPSVDQK